MSSKKWTEIGSIRMSQKGKLYIKLDSVEGLEDGVALQIEKPEDKIKRLHELGYIKDEDLEKRLEQIPSWLKYQIVLPPKQD